MYACMNVLAKYTHLPTDVKYMFREKQNMYVTDLCVCFTCPTWASYSSLHPSIDLQITKNIIYVSTDIKGLDWSTWPSASHYCLLHSQPRWYHMWVHHKKNAEQYMYLHTPRGMWHILENDTVFSHNYITFCFCTYSISTNHNFCQNFYPHVCNVVFVTTFFGNHTREKRNLYVTNPLCSLRLPCIQHCFSLHRHSVYSLLKISLMCHWHQSIESPLNKPFLLTLLAAKTISHASPSNLYTNV